MQLINFEESSTAISINTTPNSEDIFVPNSICGFDPIAKNGPGLLMPTELKQLDSSAPLLLLDGRG